MSVTQRLTVVHLTASAREGGAAIAADRICKSFESSSLVRSTIVQCILSEEVGDSNPLIRKIGSFARRVVNFLTRKLIPKSFGTSTLAILGCWSFRRAISEGGGVVHLHRVAGQSFPIWWLKRIRGPVVWTLHDYYPLFGVMHLPLNPLYGKKSLAKQLGFFLNEKISARHRSLVLDNVDAIVVPSAHMLRTLLEADAIPEEMCLTIPIPASPIFYSQHLIKLSRLNGETYNIIFIGRDADLDHNKGLDVLLGLYPKLKRLLEGLGFQLQVTVVGLSQPDSISSEPGIACFGSCEDEGSLIRFYESGNLCLMPSRRETYGQVALESTLRGCPVLYGTPNGMDDIIVQGVTGIGVADHSIDGFFLGAKEIILDQIFLNKYIPKNIRAETISKINPLRVCQQYEALYKEVSGM